MTSPWVSTQSELTGWSVPPSGLVHLRMTWPHQKLGWLESGFLPDPAQSSQRLSYLGVSLTIRNSEVSLPLYSERICKVATELDPGLPLLCAIRHSHSLDSCFLSLSAFFLYTRSLNQSYTSNTTKESQGYEKVLKSFIWVQRHPDTTVEKEQPFSILLFSLKQRLKTFLT